jgi:nucleoside-diphosphate-sugar epimerase
MDTGRSVLFIGGTGVISSACVSRAVEQGLDVTILNRGQSDDSLPEGVRRITADMRDVQAVRRSLGARCFDSVVDFLAFDAAHARTAIELFRGVTGQYVFISSASAYQTPPARLPITESTPLRNPFLKYSRGKIEAENTLLDAYREDNFPVTVVRPSHTYGRTRMPLDGRWTAVERMRQGKEIVVHGDGTSLWTLTHSSDFARFFTPMVGNSMALGEAYHITSDEVLTWNRIYELVGEAAGTTARIVHVPSDCINSADSDWGGALLGDKAHSLIFDNTKIRSLAPASTDFKPFEQGAREIVEWHDEYAERRVVDPRIDRLMDELIAVHRPR